MKQIVFIVGNYKNGGVPMHSTNLANEFAKRGIQTTILVTKDIAKDVFFPLHEKVTLVSLKQFILENQSNSIIKREEKREQRTIRMLKYLRYFANNESRYDNILEKKIRSIRKGSLLRKYFLLNQDTIAIPFGLSYYEQVYYALRGLDCKILYAERNAPELEVPSNKERAEELLELLGKANGAIFQTKDEKEYYQPFIDRNIAVIHNPIKMNLPEPYVGERRKIIVNYCRISHQKNLKLLIDAFSLIHKEFSEYVLQIYGNIVTETEEQLRVELISYVKNLGLEQYVHILPPTSDVHERVKDCAMFVSSSDFEGLSNSMIEAMAIGLPCVCTDCLGGGAREMIRHEENGLLVPMNSVESLYRGMKRIIENPELAKRCGENAAKIIEDMSVEKIADQWLEVLKNI